MPGTSKLEKIILVGGFGLPNRTASATRAIGLAKLFQSIGFDGIILGKLENDPCHEGGTTETIIEGIRCFDIRKPFPDREFQFYVHSDEPVKAVIDHLGPKSVRAVIAYNYPARGAAALIRACRVYGIPLVLDCTEWYGWEGHKVIRNLLRILGSEWRMRVLTRRAGNVICTSRYLSNLINAKNKIILPWVIDAKDPKWQPFIREDEEVDGVTRHPVQLVYCGNPGTGMFKDRLPVTVKGLYGLHKKGEAFVLDIAGITKTQYLETIPSHNELLSDMDEKIRFHGRIPHAQALDLLRRADFSIFFRPNNRVSNAGFASKYVEAATLAIPVITNDTSDLGLYLKDGHNGFLAPDISEASVANVLQRAITLTSKERTHMKHICASSSPFDIPHWQKMASDFISALRKSA